MYMIPSSLRCSEIFEILNPRASPLPRRTESVQSERSQQAQSNRQRLARLDRTGNRASSKNNGGKECELDAVRVAVLDAQAAENVQQTNSHARSDGGNGPGADVARDASTGGERTEKNSSVCERLCECQREVQMRSCDWTWCGWGALGGIYHVD